MFQIHKSSHGIHLVKQLNPCNMNVYAYMQVKQLQVTNDSRSPNLYFIKDKISYILFHAEISFICCVRQLFKNPEF